MLPGLVGIATRAQRPTVGLVVVHADPFQLQRAVPAVAPGRVDPVLLANHLPELQAAREEASVQRDPRKGQGAGTVSQQIGQRDRRGVLLGLPGGVCLAAPFPRHAFRPVLSVPAPRRNLLLLPLNVNMKTVFYTHLNALNKMPTHKILNWILLLLNGGRGIH